MATTPATTRDQYLAVAYDARENLRRLKEVDQLVQHPVSGALTPDEQQLTRAAIAALVHAWTLIETSALRDAARARR